MARVWKTFLEEYAKFDSERVEDWRDALDVLLVFVSRPYTFWNSLENRSCLQAGLFSAVVSTFVTQTSPNLQVDYNQVTAYIVYDMLRLQRAMMDGLPSDSITSSGITPTSPVHASRTDAWVNVLWFTSLALSLTTALMAVLVKQWIHQYMAVPSGTPCDRSRIRQFRFENIDAWHVPLIIGILPVLMHVALGVFFFGLVIHVRALSTPGAVLVGVIGFIAFVAYFGTTLLPLFKPDCPYKTYLTLYSYSISAYLCVSAQRSRLVSWIRCRFDTIRRHCVSPAADTQDAVTSDGLSTATWLRSLRDVERQTVASIAEALDARALIGLYHISSNTSVQRVVLQALSALPLEVLSVVKKGIPDVAERIRSLVESMEFTAPDKQTAYERLYRAHVRVEPAVPKLVPPNVLTPTLELVVRPPNALSLLVDNRHPEHAIWFMRRQITLTDSYQSFDVLVWARILQNALSAGTEWLDVGDNESPVWSKLLLWLIQTHGCLAPTACDTSCTELISLPLIIEDCDDNFGSLDPRTFRLKVRKYPRLDTARPIQLRWVMTLLMRPSIAEYFFHVLFPDTCRGADYTGLPADILLNLALVQTHHVLLTSKFGVTDDEDEDEEQPAFSPNGIVVPVKHKTPMAKLLYIIRKYVGVIKDMSNVPGGTLRQHPAVIRATFRALSGIIHSDVFLNGTLASSDKRKMLHALARTFLLDTSPNQDLICEFCSGMSAVVHQEIAIVVFRDFPRLKGSVELTIELLDAHNQVDPARTPSKSLGIEIYRQLAQRDWLTEWLDHLHKALRESRVRTGIDIQSFRLYFFLAASYVEGLEVLRASSSSTFTQTVAYLSKSNNLAILCKMLVLSDDSRRVMLDDLALLFPEHWELCIQEVLQYFRSDDGRQCYNMFREHFHLDDVPCYDGRKVEELEYSSLEDMLVELSNLHSQFSVGDSHSVSVPSVLVVSQVS